MYCIMHSWSTSLHLLPTHPSGCGCLSNRAYQRDSSGLQVGGGGERTVHHGSSRGDHGQAHVWAGARGDGWGYHW